MADKHWKAFERRVAEFFGLRRVPLSGGASGHGTRADLMRRRGEESRKLYLFCELKHWVKMAVFTLFYDTRELAEAERKIPVLMLGKRGDHGFLVVIHSDRFDFVMSELVKLRQEVLEHQAIGKNELF